MDDFSGEGLFILAAIVIAFVNWLSNTLKQKAAQREMERRRAKGEPVEERPRVPVVSEDEGWPSPDEPITPHAEANTRLREFFESLVPQESQPPPPPEEIASAPVPARQPIQRVPAPSSPRERVEHWKVPEVKRAKLSASERRALKALQERRVSKATGSAASGQHPLIAKLRVSGGAREAIVFAEILGKPKALADSEPLY